MRKTAKKVANVPNLRFPGFTKLWEVKKIGDITSKVNSGKTPIGGEAVYTHSGILFIRSQNINNDRLVLENSVFITDSVNSQMKNSIVQSNDILLNITGASLGRSCVVPNDFKTGNVNQHVCIIRLHEQFDPHFIQPILSSKKGQLVFNSLQTGSGREGLNFESIKGIKLFMPDYLEQQKIAVFLSRLNMRIQTQNKIIECLKTQMLGLQSILFGQKINLNEGNKNFYPKWEYKLGGELFDSISNKKHNSDLPILAITQEHGAIPRELIDYQMTVTDKSIENYKVVEIGDFIISLRSFQGGIEFSNYKGICSPAYVILRNKIKMNLLFYKYYFKTDFYIKMLNKKLEGIRDGKMISYTYFSEISLPFPSLEEQDWISNILTKFDQKISIEMSILENLEKQKKYFLQQMFV